MNRSFINAKIIETIEYLKTVNLHLPPFAYFTPETWQNLGHDYDEIRQNMLGWDMTDYNGGDYANLGLLLFTIRNGNLKNPNFAKPYAEKMLLVELNQHAPNHFHFRKTEDIINRGGGVLAMQVWNADEAEGLANTDVICRIDGCKKTIPSGGIVRLLPGESITLEPYTYHQFWAENDRVLAWEVSSVNDDVTDNRFFEPLPRFSSITEDEPALFLLCNEYPEA